MNRWAKYLFGSAAVIAVMFAFGVDAEARGPGGFRSYGGHHGGFHVRPYANYRPHLHLNPYVHRPYYQGNNHFHVRPYAPYRPHVHLNPYVHRPSYGYGW